MIECLLNTPKERQDVTIQQSASSPIALPIFQTHYLGKFVHDVLGAQSVQVFDYTFLQNLPSICAFLFQGFYFFVLKIIKVRTSAADSHSFVSVLRRQPITTCAAFLCILITYTKSSSRNFASQKFTLYWHLLSNHQVRILLRSLKLSAWTQRF